MEDPREDNVERFHEWLKVLIEKSTKFIKQKEIDIKKPWYNLNMKKLKNKMSELPSERKQS